MAAYLTSRKLEVVLGMSRLSIPNKLVKARFIVGKLTGNPNFPDPKPSIDTLQKKITLAEDTIKTTTSGARGTASPMYAAVRSMEIAFLQLKTMVEAAANNDEVNGISIIESAGMTLKIYPLRTSPGFSVKVGVSPGEVLLRTQAYSRGTYIYQMSTDPKKPEGWKTIITSTVSKCRYVGLTSDTKYYFRVATIRKHVQGPWSRVLSINAL